MTRDEVAADIAIPMLRAVIQGAASAAELAPDKGRFVVPNPVRDCMPIQVERESLENGGAGEMLARLDEIERKVRARIARTTA